MCTLPDIRQIRVLPGAGATLCGDRVRPAERGRAGGVGIKEPLSCRLGCCLTGSCGGSSTR